MAVNQTGASDDFAYCEGDAYFKNLYISGTDNIGKQNRYTMAIYGDKRRIIMDGLHIDQSRQTHIRTYGTNCNIFFYNCELRNSIDLAAPSNGRFFDGRGLMADTILWQNNTIYLNSQRMFRMDGAIVKNLIFDHNTFYQNAYGSSTSSGTKQSGGIETGKVVKARITNNIFQDINVEGMRHTRSLNPPDRQPIIHVDSIKADTLFTESARDWVVRNNAYGWYSGFKTFWATIDTLKAPAFISPYGDSAFFRNKPNFKQLNNFDEDLRARVSSLRLNFRDPVYDVGPPLQVVFCRNAHIYFDAGAKRRFVAHCAAALEAGGSLFVGHSESLHGLSTDFELIHFPDAHGLPKAHSGCPEETHMDPDRVTADVQELLPDYLADAREGLEKVSGILLALDRGESDPEFVAELFRQMHIIKGGSGLMGFPLVGKVAHGAEDLLGAVKKVELPLGPRRCGELSATCSLSTLSAGLLYSDRDVGIMLDGEVGGRLRYAAALTNGQLQNVRETNSGKSVTGRVALRSLKDVVIAGNVAYKDYLHPNTDAPAHAVAWGADVEVGNFTRGLHIQTGAIGGDNWRVAIGDTAVARFLTGQLIATYKAPLSHRWIKGLEPVVRASWTDPVRSQADDDGWLVTPGVILHFGGRTMLHTNLDVWVPTVGDTEYAFRTQMNFYF